MISQAGDFSSPRKGEIKLYRPYNPNPVQSRVGDCVIRAISKATAQDWEKTYIDLALQGLIMHDMPSANHVWGQYLRGRGFVRHPIPDECPDCYTLGQFCADHPRGTYVVAVDKHVICVVDGDHYDTWDSSQEVPMYYWEKDGVDE